MAQAFPRAVAFVITLLLAIAPRVSASSGEPPPGYQPSSPYLASHLYPTHVVILVLDGGLPSYLRLGDFPHLAALVRRGVTYPRAWDGMLETETPTGHATLGTGTLPRRHGVVSFGWVTDRAIRQQPTNPIPIQQGQLEDLLRQSGVPSLASALKEQHPQTKVVVTSGHKDYAVDAVGGWAADYLMYYAVRGQTWTPIAIPRHVPPQPVMQEPGLTEYAPHLAPGDQDSLAVRLALSAFRHVHQEVTIVNLPEFDWPLGHLQGGARDPGHAWQLMHRLDGDVAAIEAEFSKARVLQHTLFVITSDHGMATLHHTVPYTQIQAAVAASKSSLSKYDFHTAGYLWLSDRKRGLQVASSILRLHNPYIRAVYYQIPGKYAYERVTAGSPYVSPAVDAAYRFLLGTLVGPNAPQVTVFLAENTSILGENQHGWQGDHGGPSWNAQHIPLIIAGPGVREGKTSYFPATLYDVAPTILSLMRSTPRGMDGITLADAMLQPVDDAVRRQDADKRPRMSTVQALIDQSARDGW